MRRSSSGEAMTFRELANECAKAINQPANASLSGPATISLVMPSRKNGDSRKRYLAGRRSPLGDVVEEITDGEVVLFDAIDVLAWLKANDLADIMVKVIP